MAVKSRDTLKTYFENGDKPNEGQFSDLIDSLVHVTEGGESGSTDGTAGTGVIEGITTDENGNIIFNFVGGTSINISTNGTAGTVKMPIPYLDSYDNFYFVSEEKGNDANALPNSYRFYKSIVAASEAARLNYDATGNKNMVYVCKSTYNEESVNREHVDMYFENGAVVWVDGTDKSVINDKLEPVVNANVYGKGTFVNKNYTSWDDREGINMRQASSMYIEAKLIDGIQLYNNDPIHFEFANIDILFRVASWHNKSMKFKNCRFLNGLKLSPFRKNGGKEVYENCEFILPEFHTNDVRNKSVDILDYKGGLIVRVQSGELDGARQLPIDTDEKTLDAIIAETYDHSSEKVESPETSCLLYYQQNTSRDMGSFQLEVRNSKFIIQQQNGIGIILAKRKNSSSAEGHVIINNVTIIDETAEKNSVALVTGWGDAATQQPDLLINSLSHNCGTRQKVLAEGYNEWKITFDTIGNFVPNTGGTFKGDVYVSNSETNYPGVYLGANGDLKTYHKIPIESGIGGGLSVSSDEKTGVVSFQFRTKPDDFTGDQTLQIGYYNDPKYIATPVASMQMFQPNSLFVIGGWLGQKGSGEGFKEGDKFRVLNGNAEIDGKLRSKELKVTEKIELENSFYADSEGNFYVKRNEIGQWSHISTPNTRQRRFNDGNDISLQENYVKNSRAFDKQETLERYAHLNDGCVFFRLTNNRSQIAVGWGDVSYGVEGYPGWEINDNFLAPKGYIADFRTKKLRVVDGDADFDGVIRANEILVDGKQVATQDWVNTITAAIIAGNTRTAGDKADDADKLDGIDSTGFARQEAIPSATLKIGWYTIAVNGGSRASAKFVLRETRSGRHGSIHFYAAHNFGNGNVLTVLSNSWHGGGGSIRYIRLKEAGTYDGVALQIYVDTDDAPVSGIVLEDIQSSGWTPKAWTLDATDPGGLKDYSILTNIAAQIDLDKTLGINTSADIYSMDNRVHKENEDINATDTEIIWSKNSDKAAIGFKNNGDSDTDSYLYFKTADNNNEYFKWLHDPAGSTDIFTEWMQLKSTALKVAGDIHANGTGYYGDNKKIIQFSDAWLRLNPSSHFTSGIYCGSKVLRTDGQFQVGSGGNRFKVETNGNTTVYGNLSGKSVNSAYSHLYRFGGLHFTWDSDTYGTNAQHSIKSAYGTSMGDSLTMNSYNNIRLNIDSNNNNANSKFEIGHNTSGTANVLFSVDETGSANASGKLLVKGSEVYYSGNKPTSLDNFIDYGRTGSIHGYDDDGALAANGSANYRKTLASGLYSYRTYNGIKGSPAGYGAAVGFGDGARGSVEIMGKWTGSGGELWTRSLRDCCQNWSEWQKMWTSGNDGAGSGLDADKLDGIEGSGYVRKGVDAAHSWNGNYLIFSHVNSSNVDAISYNDSTNAFCFNADRTKTNTSGNATIYAGSINSSSNIVASGNVSAYSDKRLKKAIQPIKESFLDKIDQLKPSFYQWKDKAKEQTQQLGFIAQEVKEIFPQWVHKNEEHLSISYDKMGAVLAVKGIQELHTEIKNLKEELKQLKYGVTN